jgi:hypothetical protein
MLLGKEAWPEGGLFANVMWQYREYQSPKNDKGIP